MEQEEVDILCIQETWLAEGAQTPELPGFKVVEARRSQGARGGIATFFRQQFQLEASIGNEYGQLTKLILPNSQRINVVNVYLPPTSSLTRRGIAEAQATTMLAEVMD